MQRAGIFPALFAALLAAPAPAQEAPRLAFPLTCTLGHNCYIQNHVDADPGPGAQDFTCGGLSYDGHAGTDFTLFARDAMDKGVAVLAVAPGTVLRVRDGMPDLPWTPDQNARIDGRDCGNGFVIDHGGGWESQYCHLRQDTVRVAPGDRVDTGDILGLVGQSGRAELPHLHLTLRHDGKVVDPFAPDGGSQACGPQGPGLWAEAIAYQPGDLLRAGLSGALPTFDQIKENAPEDATAGSTALVLWVQGFGARTGDVIRFAIDGPEGRIHASETVMEKPLAHYFRAAGKRMREGLPPGDYSATATLVRDGRPFAVKEVALTVHP